MEIDDMITDPDGIEAVQIDLAERVQVLEDKVAQFEEAIMGAMQHPMMSQVLRMMGVDPTKATPADLLKG